MTDITIHCSAIDLQNSESRQWVGQWSAGFLIMSDFHELDSLNYQEEQNELLTLYRQLCSLEDQKEQARRKYVENCLLKRQTSLLPHPKEPLFPDHVYREILSS